MEAELRFTRISNPSGVQLTHLGTCQKPILQDKGKFVSCLVGDPSAGSLPGYPGGRIFADGEAQTFIAIP